MNIFKRHFRGNFEAYTVINYGLLIIFTTLISWFCACALYVIVAHHEIDDASSNLLATYAFSTSVILQLSYYDRIAEDLLERFMLFCCASVWIALIAAVIGSMIYIQSIADWSSDTIIFFITTTLWPIFSIILGTSVAIYRTLESLNDYV